MNLPTDEVTKIKSVSGSPSSFIATSAYPTINTGFTSKNANIINKIADLLNTAIFYTSNGQIDLNRLKSNNFTLGTSDIPSEDLKNLIGFSKAIYNNLFTNKSQNFKDKVSQEELLQIINSLKSNQFIQNLSSLNPSGQLATKIPGNLKSLIITELSNIT